MMMLSRGVVDQGCGGCGRSGMWELVSLVMVLASTLKIYFQGH